MATTEWATRISRVLDGKVLIRVYSHERLIGDRGYADGVFLTLRGELPTGNERRMTEALLNSLLDHGFVAASVLAARYCASGNPQLIPATAAGLLTAGSNTISTPWREKGALPVARRRSSASANRSRISMPPPRW